MSNTRQEFTIALNDLFSSSLGKVSARANKSFRSIEKDIDGVTKKSKRASYSIEDIDKRLDALKKIRRISIDTNAIKAANREIKQLELQKTKLEGVGGGGFLGKMLPGGMARFLGPMAIAAGAFAVGRAGINFAKSGLELSKINEQNAVSFEVLLGSATKANIILNDIADFAAKTPFQKLEVTSAAQSLIAFGVDAKKVIPTIRMLGDASRGNAETFKSVVDNYGKAISAQRLRTQDINQFAIAGVPMWAELEKITGLTGEALRKYVEKNGISIKQMNQAFASMTSKGGMFFGMMDKQSETTTGRISTLKDNMDELKMAVGDRMKPTMDKFIDSGSASLSLFTKLSEVRLSEKLQGEAAEMTALVSSVTNYNITGGQRIALINELQTKYPGFFANIDAEKIKNQELLDILGKVNNEYDRKISLASQEEIVSVISDREKELNSEIVRLTKINALMRKYNEHGDNSLIYLKAARKQENAAELWERISYYIIGGVVGRKTTEGMREKILAKQDIGTDYSKDKIEKLQSKLAALQNTKIVEEEQLRIEKIKDSFVEMGKIGVDLLKTPDEVLAKYFANSKKKGDEFIKTYTWILNMLKIGYRGEMIPYIEKLAGSLTSKNAGYVPGDMGGSGGNTTLTNGAIAEVSGDKLMQKNVTLNINNMINGDFVVSTTNLQEGADKTKEIIMQTLLDAANNANYIAS